MDTLVKFPPPFAPKWKIEGCCCALTSTEQVIHANNTVSPKIRCFLVNVV